MNAIVQYSPDQMALIKRTVAQGATDDELNLFIYDCQRRNIHPLDKLLHFTKRGGRYVPITSIDLMRSRAAHTGQMAGSDDAVFVDGDGKTPVSATVTVYRLHAPLNGTAQKFAYTATARWSEYNPGGPMWTKMPYTMLAKCAEALALRKAFPQELAGLYAKEEMDQADAPVHRAAPKIGPNVINNPASPPTPDAAPATGPQQEPAAESRTQGGGLPIQLTASSAPPGVTPTYAPAMPPPYEQAPVQPMPPIATEAFKVASTGLADYERWWLTLSKSERKQLLPYHEMIKGAAAEADNTC